MAKQIRYTPVAAPNFAASNALAMDAANKVSQGLSNILGVVQEGFDKRDAAEAEELAYARKLGLEQYAHEKHMERVQFQNDLSVAAQIEAEDRAEALSIRQNDRALAHAVNVEEQRQTFLDAEKTKRLAGQSEGDWSEANALIESQGLGASIQFLQNKDYSQEAIEAFTKSYEADVAAKALDAQEGAQESTLIPYMSLPADVRKTITRNSEAINGALEAKAKLDNVEKLLGGWNEEESKYNAERPQGSWGSLSEWSKGKMHMNSQYQPLIQAFNELSIGAFIDNLPPGVASDKDIELLKSTVPDALDSDAAIRNWLEAYNRVVSSAEGYGRASNRFLRDPALQQQHTSAFEYWKSQGSNNGASNSATVESKTHSSPKKLTLRSR